MQSAIHGILEQGGSQIYQQILCDNAFRDRLNFGTLSSNTRTIELIFKPTATITVGSPVLTLVSRRVSSTNLAQAIDISFNSGTLTCIRWDATTTAASVSSDITTWNAGQEYFLVFVIDPVTGMKMYVDGVAQTSTNPTTTGFVTSAASVFFMGNFANNIRWMDGTVRQVSFWSTARTPAEIATDGTTIFDGTETGLVDYYPFLNEQDATITGVKGNLSSIFTDNVGGNTYINSTMRQII